MREITLDPAVKIGVTADLHRGHRNIIKYCLRPFLTELEVQTIRAGLPLKVSDDALERHDAALVDNINATLGQDDVLILIGDLTHDHASLADYRELRDRVNVKDVYVAVGNHDNEDALAYVYGRDRVLERFVLHVGRNSAVIDHYPGDSWLKSHHGYWQLSGHCHGGKDARRALNLEWSLSLDVGVDSHDLKPWLWHEELVPLMWQRRERWQTWRNGLGDKDKGGMAAGK